MNLENYQHFDDGYRISYLDESSKVYKHECFKTLHTSYNFVRYLENKFKKKVKFTITTIRGLRK